MGQSRYLNSVLAMLRCTKLGEQDHYPNYKKHNIYNTELGQPDYPNPFDTFRRIMGSDTLYKAMLYLLDAGVVTKIILINHLGIPEHSAKWAIKTLGSLKLIAPALKVHDKLSKGGPKETVWSLPSATDEQINRAIIFHNQLKSPKYLCALELAQTILMENPAPVPRVDYERLRTRAKQRFPNYASIDVAKLAAQYLREKGAVIVYER